MVQNEAETIVAKATARGQAGIGVIRISGSNTQQIAKQILGKVPKPRFAEYLSFSDLKGESLDQGIAIFFPAPHSFTGEDVLELQGHGGPVIMDCLVKEAITAGARMATPGEFSLRAYLNNKMDLLQAEAVADLIHANSLQAARGALRSMQGAFSKRVEEIVQEVIKLRMFVEASIDFPEEELDFLNDGRIQEMLNNIRGKLEVVIAKAKEGTLLSEGVKVVIMGRPNAGKSSLLNALSGQESAIVTEIPGTTRDVLREHFVIDGLLIQLVDTAGLRMAEDIVEKEGVRRALQEMSLADHVILVVDGTENTETNPVALFPECLDKFPEGVGITVLVNKIDKHLEKARLEKKEGHTVLRVSAKTGEGLDLFRDHLKTVFSFSENSEGNFIARRRHLEALSIAKQHLLAGELQLKDYKAGELLAEELRLAQLALDQLTGKFTTDDLLGKIFSEFCIGK